GLNLWPNGVRVLRNAGVGPEYSAACAEFDRYITLTASGELVSNEPLDDWEQRFGAPQTGVYRGDLHSILSSALGSERVRLGHRLVDFADDGVCVRAKFANGVVADGDLLV